MGITQEKLEEMAALDIKEADISMLADIRDIETDDKKGIFKVFLQDGDMFEVECRQVIC